MFEYQAEIVRIIDADTIELKIDLGFHTHRDEKVRILFKNGDPYDAPETRLIGDTTEEDKHRGLLAKARAENILPVGSRVLVNTFYDKKGKYGRFLAAIKTPDGEDFAQLMTREGHVK